MELLIVDCSEEFWEFVRMLRLDSRVVDGFIETSLISKNDQIRYMSANSVFYKICLVNGVPAGYFGVIENDIRICTHPDFQGLGLGKFMIEECMKIWPFAIAKVKTNNFPSHKLFINSGFQVFKKDQKFTYYKV